MTFVLNEFIFETYARWAGAAGHYGFTDEGLGFIPSTLLRAGINYDIKYRMDQETDGDRL